MQLISIILDGLSLQQDRNRAEEDVILDFVDNLLASDYPNLGYNLEKVQKMSNNAWLEFILERLHMCGEILGKNRHYSIQ